MDKKMTTTQTTLFPEIENFDIPASANRKLSVSIISYKESINAPLEKLWKIISAPKNLNFCHPYCKKPYFSLLTMNMYGIAMLLLKNTQLFH